MAERDWVAAQVPIAVICAKQGGGACEGAGDWWVVNRRAKMKDGPHCERHARLLADSLHEDNVRAEAIMQQFGI